MKKVKLSERTIQGLTLKWIDISVMDIVCCKAYGDCTKITMRDGIIHTISGNLAKTTRLINTEGFIRISRFYLANIDYFNWYDNTDDKGIACFNNIEELPVSPDYRKKFRKIIKAIEGSMVVWSSCCERNDLN